MSRFIGSSYQDKGETKSVGALLGRGGVIRRLLFRRYFKPRSNKWRYVGLVRGNLENQTASKGRGNTQSICCKIHGSFNRKELSPKFTYV